MRSRIMQLTEAGLLLCLLSLIAVCAAHPLYAVDFFWHLKLGEVIASSGQIPHTDLFSAARPERTYTQFNWLWEWSAARVVEHWGLRGVRVVQGGILALSFAGFFAVVRTRLRFAELAFACTALAFVLFEDRFQERPSALAFGFLAALGPLLLGFDQLAQRQRVLIVLLVGGLWANLHGGESLLLPLSLLALCAGSIVNRRWLGRRMERAAPSFALLGLSLACLCASPTFLTGLWHWSALIGQQVATGNEEWQPTYTMLANGLRPSFVSIALAPSVVTIVYVTERWRAVRAHGKSTLDARELLMAAGYLALSQQAVRNAFLCLLPLLFVLQRMAAGELRTRSRVLFAAAALLLTSIAAEDALPYAYGGMTRFRELFADDLSPGAFPELAADFLHEAQLEGGIVNDGHFGGYLIWRVWPRCGVFADSRHHFDAAMWPVFSATHDPLRRVAGLEVAFARWSTELTAFRGPTFPLGAPPQFRLLFKAGDQEIYQDLRGKHARDNIARTQAWLQKQHVIVPDDVMSEELPALVTQLGATRYLAQTFQRLRAREAKQLIASSDPAARGHGFVERGELRYEVGDFHGAAEQFEHAIERLPSDPAPAYAAALCYFALRDAASFERSFMRFAQSQDLAPRKRHKLEAMRAILRSSSTASR